VKYFLLRANFFAFFTLAFALVHIAKADSGCATDVIKPFIGKFQGQAVLLHADGTQDLSGTKASYIQLDCQSFQATFNYLDSNGNIVRTINLTAVADPQQAGSFAINNGTTSDSTGQTTLTGTFTQIQDGTLLGTFTGALKGKPVYMTELWNVTNSQNGIRQLVRTVQMFAGRGGSYIATRVDSEQSNPESQNSN
jgi:hypothetical protein